MVRMVRLWRMTMGWSDWTVLLVARTTTMPYSKMNNINIISVIKLTMFSIKLVHWWKIWTLGSNTLPLKYRLPDQGLTVNAFHLQTGYSQWQRSEIPKRQSHQRSFYVLSQLSSVESILRRDLSDIIIFSSSPGILVKAFVSDSRLLLIRELIFTYQY